MRLVLDTVQGAEADIEVYSGRIIRTGLIIDPPIGLAVGSPSSIVSGLAASGMPQKGDRYPDPEWQDYRVHRHYVRSLTYRILAVNIVYTWNGLLTISDTSTLTNVQTQIHPNGNLPIYVSWTNPNAPGATVKRVATFNTTLPLRHVVAKQTIDHPASQAILDAFGSVNAYPWYGLDTGYWMFSGLEGYSEDNGITYTYQVTMTTKQVENWSQIEYLRDERGVAVIVPNATVQQLRNTIYSWSITQVNGLTMVGMHRTKDFSQLFGFGS